MGSGWRVGGRNAEVAGCKLRKNFSADTESSSLAAGDLLIHRLLGGVDLSAEFVPSTTTREQYAQRITSGGMPVALRRPPGRSRSRWFANYLDLVIERDVIELTRVRQREMLPRLLNVLAARSGQVLNIATTAQAVGMEKSHDGAAA